MVEDLEKVSVCVCVWGGGGGGGGGGQAKRIYFRINSLFPLLHHLIVHLSVCPSLPQCILHMGVTNFVGSVSVYHAVYSR